MPLQYEDLIIEIQPLSDIPVTSEAELMVTDAEFAAWLDTWEGFPDPENDGPKQEII